MSKVIRLSGKIRLDHLVDLTEMMMALKHETEPGKASDDDGAYLGYIKHKLKTSFVYYYQKTGFCIIDTAYDPLLSCPHNRYFMMSHIYIVPKKRKTRSYAEIFGVAMKNHSGQMIGITYEGGNHDAILLKRFKKLGTVYGRELWAL